MRAKLTALLAGLALLGLAEAARADALTATNAPALTLPALTDSWSLQDTQPAMSESTEVVMLTDAQLDNSTAGASWHLWNSYWGFYFYGTWYQFYSNMYLWY